MRAELGEFEAVKSSLRNITAAQQDCTEHLGGSRVELTNLRAELSELAALRKQLDQSLGKAQDCESDAAGDRAARAELEIQMSALQASEAKVAAARGVAEEQVVISRSKISAYIQTSEELAAKVAQLEINVTDSTAQVTKCTEDLATARLHIKAAAGDTRLLLMTGLKQTLTVDLAAPFIRHARITAARMHGFFSAQLGISWTKVSEQWTARVQAASTAAISRSAELPIQTAQEWLVPLRPVAYGSMVLLLLLTWLCRAKRRAERQKVVTLSEQQLQWVNAALCGNAMQRVHDLANKSPLSWDSSNGGEYGCDEHTSNQEGPCKPETS